MKLYIRVVKPDTGIILDTIGSGTEAMLGFSVHKLLMPFIIIGTYSNQLMMVGIVFLGLSLVISLILYYINNKSDLRREELGLDDEAMSVINNPNEYNKEK